MARQSRPLTEKTELEVWLGQAEHPVGRLTYAKAGPREFSQFAYLSQWLENPVAFDISPDLDRVAAYQVRKRLSKDDSCFFLALADTAPDTWGRRVISRAHAKAREKDASLRQLTELDFLSAVDDFSRIGALRLRAPAVGYLRSAEKGQHNAPPLLELEKIMSASRALELSKETLADLKYLQGKATSLGGLRPKCTLVDEDGALALGKFPSVKDERSVTRGEVLALRLAKLAGIEVADARIVLVQSEPVVVVRRFDRTLGQGRIPYISGATLLQAGRNDERTYTELLDQMRAKCMDFAQSARQLWRRIVFNHLITNVDDHLHNIGFLYAEKNMWRLAPAFDLNPFPDRDRESKTWLSEDTGPVTSVGQLMGQAARFELKPTQALKALSEVVGAVSQWREVARSPAVEINPKELATFSPAFQHGELEAARKLLDHA